MPKSIDRFCKAKVALELATVQRKVNWCTHASRDDLENAFREAYPNEVEERQGTRSEWLAGCTREFLTARLILSATHYMALVLSID